MPDLPLPEDTTYILIDRMATPLDILERRELVDALGVLDPGRAIRFAYVPRGGGGGDWAQIASEINRNLDIWLPWAWGHLPDAEQALKVTAAVAGMLKLAKRWRDAHKDKKVVTAFTIYGPRGEVLRSVKVGDSGNVTDLTEDRQQWRLEGRPPFYIEQ